MQLIGRVLLLAVCLYSACSLPNISNANAIDDIDNVYHVMMAQMRSALIDTRALSPSETNCANNYNNRTQQINNDLTNQTNACFETANKTMISNESSLNVTVTTIRADLKAVEVQLATCGNITDTMQFLNCTTANFDSNMARLDNANSQAYLANAQLSVQQTGVDIVRKGCISAAIGHAKTNVTHATNDYQTCLDNIKNQREAPKASKVSEISEVSTVSEVSPVVDLTV